MDAALEASSPEAAVDASTLPPWPHDLPPAAMLSSQRGYRAVRAIVHSHSVHSHDACDGNPYVDGGPNEPCLQDFRSGACRANLDVIFLTEHAGLMAEGPFERVLQQRAGDEPVMESGRLVGYRIPCPDGHRVLVLPGAENELMPLALTQHPQGTAGESLNTLYHANDAAGVARFRAAGAIVAVAHTEQRTVEELRALSPDLMEVYNVHANLDPRIATPYLMIDPGEFVNELTAFLARTNRLEADLVPMVFFRENTVDLNNWSALLAEGRTLPAAGGSDVHQNAIPGLLFDGERGDSYRRIFRYFANMLLVQGEVTRSSALEALRGGRFFVGFEAWGSPQGFDWFAQAGSAVTEAGGTVMLSAQPQLRVTLPRVFQLSAMLPSPMVRARILRATPTGWVEVAAGTTDLTFTPTMAGAYRAEVRIVPNHAAPYLPRHEALVRDLVWVYSQALYVR